jgi:selenocysteine lyase/cysteine desulfurase
MCTRVLVDGAQAVSHMPVDVQALDADFYAFSGHKVFAPTGIGVLYGKPQAFEESPPWQGGGNMIADVTFEKTIYQPPPALRRFGLETTVRPSLALYNTRDDIDALVASLRQLRAARRII